MLEHRQPHELSIVEAGVALRNGSLTALELTESVLSRVEETEPLLNAYITVTADLAREQAAAADDALRDGRDLGPMHGIPIALKDLVDTAGVATTGGSGFLRERIPDADATVYTKLKAAGAVQCRASSTCMSSPSARLAAIRTTVRSAIPGIRSACPEAAAVDRVRRWQWAPAWARSAPTPVGAFGFPRRSAG